MVCDGGVSAIEKTAHQRARRKNSRHRIFSASAPGCARNGVGCGEIIMKVAIKRLRLTFNKKQWISVLAWIGGVVAAYVAAAYLSSGLFWALLKIGALPFANQTVLTLAQRVVVYMIIVAFLLAGAWRLQQALSRRDMGLWRLLDWRDIGLGIVGVFVYLVLTVLLLAIARSIPGFDINQAQDTGLGKLYSYDLLMAFLVLVIATPFFEELLFRGILYGRLRSLQLPWWLAAIIISALFGVAHMQWNVAVDVFALSLVMCVLREKTESIWAGFLVHVIKNFVAFYVVFVAA